MQSTDLIGYLAALLVAAAFCMKSIVGLRSVAILSNIAFLTYAHLGGLMPVLLLHLVLLPVEPVPSRADPRDRQSASQGQRWRDATLHGGRITP